MANFTSVSFSSVDNTLASPKVPPNTIPSTLLQVAHKDFFETLKDPADHLL